MRGAWKRGLSRRAARCAATASTSGYVCGGSSVAVVRIILSASSHATGPLAKRSACPEWLNTGPFLDDFSRMTSNGLELAF